MENDISGRIVRLFTYRSKLNKHKKIIKMYVRRAQNTADGKGATFAFSLPLSKQTYDITNQGDKSAWTRQRRHCSTIC